MRLSELTKPEIDAIVGNANFTEEELDMAAKELKYIEKHPEEYKSYNNIQELKGALLNDEKL